MLSFNVNVPEKSIKSRLESAESSWTRYFSILFWRWIYPTLSIGNKRLINENDLDGLPLNDTASILLKRLEIYDWKSTTIWKIIFKEFLKDFLPIGLFCFPYLISRIAQPLLIRKITLLVTNNEKFFYNTFLFFILLSLSIIVQIFFDHQINFRSIRIGIRIRNALTSIIYKHLLSMKLKTSKDLNIGQIINLISSDTYKFEEICVRAYSIFEGPIEIVIIFICLCFFMPFISIMFSFLVLILLFLILLLTGQYFSQYREITLYHSDKRINAFKEFIHNCHIIKMFNWEKSIEKQINHMRKIEFNYLKRAYYLRTINIIQSFVVPAFLGLIIFLTCWLLDYSLNPADCFATLSFLGLLRNQMMFLIPLITEKFRDIQVASDRINNFMNRNHSWTSKSSLDFQGKGKITISDAAFSWDNIDTCLKSINLTIEPGTFVGITGPVGSGKSSLLSAIVGEMNLIQGQINRNNNLFAYVSQSPWLFVDTIRNNIILNRKFDSERYSQVIYSCCLDVDLCLFGSNGDLTVIGEDGINLSGGQKSRICLARALYSDVDVYLLDDPFSTIDNIVANQIYERCISSNGLLKNKTRLLVTHQTNFLIDADQILYVSEGSIDSNERIIDEYFISKTRNDNQTNGELAAMLDNNVSINETQSIMSNEKSMNKYESWSICLKLFTKSSYGIIGLCLLIVLIILTQLFYDSTNYWFSIWIQQSFINENQSSFHIFVYIGLTLLTILTDILRTILYFLIILNGSNKFHENMLTCLLNTSIEFFENNPSGRILNRICRDQKILDETLPTILLYTIKSLFLSIGSIIIICFIKIYVIVFFLILIPMFYRLYRFYLRSRHQLKQLENRTRSPIYELFSSTLNGLDTIRSFNSENYFIHLFTERIDRNTCAYLNMQGASRWFALRLNLIPFINLLIIGFIFILFHDDIDSSLIALYLTYAISIPKSFQMTFQQLSDVDLLLTSAERIYQYGQLECEEEQMNDREYVCLPRRPITGNIEFRNYSLRHRSNLDYILKNIDLTIRSGEKIGIIGRTGSGKSSIFKGIFRLINQTNTNGEILIDNIDINNINLKYLRSFISIIPQTPMLFRGTLRYNLDPLNNYSDDQCWSVLEDVQLKTFVQNNSSGLSMFISESGQNLSIGQCQLICIARVLLRKSRIVLIDEATSNVDKETDEIIQKLIQNKFQGRTILTIAHRHHTLSNYDRIIILDNGKILNCDTSDNILQQFH